MVDSIKINAENQFNQLVENIFNDKKEGEFITLSFGGEKSHFLRFSQSKIRQNGGIDLQLLGIGTNGHIGFNEPTSSLSSRTRVKTLTQNTITNNSRFFENNEVQPSIAITMGIGTIMEAQNIILIGLGKHKSKAVADLVEGPVSSFCPGSVLQNHRNAVVVLDNLAASNLKLYDYYIHTEKMYLEFMC